MAERFKAVVRRRNASDDEGATIDDIWPPELRWVADWNRYDAETGRFISGCASPHETHAEALAEAVAEADAVRRANRVEGVVCGCGESFHAEGTVHGQPAALWELLGHRAAGCVEGLFS